MVFSDSAIHVSLTMKVLFKLPLRQTFGMVACRLRLTNLDWPVPDYTNELLRSSWTDFRLR